MGLAGLFQVAKLFSEKLSPENLEEPIFDTGLFANLVMAEAQKKRLLALVTSYARMEKDGTSITQPAWSADFVKGKGQGLIFLLHGSPGVGKTCTAGEPPLDHGSLSLVC